MQHLESYVGGQWVKGSQDGQSLVNPATEESLASASSDGIDLAAALQGSRPLIQDLAEAGTQA